MGLTYRLHMAVAVLALAAPPLLAQPYALTVIVEGQGTVEVDPNGATYPSGTVVDLTALPDPGWRLVRWEGDPNITMSDLVGVWGSGPSDVFVAGSHGTIVHHDGANWSVMTAATSLGLYGLWGSGPNDVFAVGGNEFGSAYTIQHYDGSSWSQMIGGTTYTLFHVWGAGPNDVFAVGLGPGGGTILHYDGASWSDMPDLPTGLFAGVWGSGPNDVYAVGYLGRILHYDGATFSAMTSPTQELLVGVWGSGPNDVFAVGTAGTILHYDGNGATWSSMANGSEIDLHNIWGTGPNDAFAVGTAGTILHYDGATWSASDSGTTTDLFGVWGTGRDDVYVAGYDGTIRHYDGTTWSWPTISTDPNVQIVMNADKQVTAVFAQSAVLTVSIKKQDYGAVIVDPCAPGYEYACGTELTLTAVPNSGKVFKKWEIDDPCHPGDANHIVVDSNNPIAIVMSGDREVKAFFKCGGGTELMQPVLTVALLGIHRLRRRRSP